MKNMVKAIVALLIVIGAALSATAAVDSASLATYCRVLPLENERTFKVLYQSQEVENVKLAIIDGQDDVVYTETVKNSNGFAKDFDLSNLPEGDYTISVMSENYSFNESVSISDWEMEQLHLVFTEVESRYALVGTNSSQEEVTFYIYDVDGNELYQEKLPAGQSVKKIFDLQNLKGKEASFVIFGKNGVRKEKLVKL